MAKEKIRLNELGLHIGCGECIFDIFSDEYFRLIWENHQIKSIFYTYLDSDIHDFFPEEESTLDYLILRNYVKGGSGSPIHPATLKMLKMSPFSSYLGLEDSLHPYAVEVIVAYLNSPRSRERYPSDFLMNRWGYWFGITSSFAFAANSYEEAKEYFRQARMEDVLSQLREIL